MGKCNKNIAKKQKGGIIEAMSLESPNSGIGKAPTVQTAEAELQDEFRKLVIAIADPFDMFREIFGKGGEMTRKK